MVTNIQHCTPRGCPTAAAQTSLGWMRTTCHVYHSPFAACAAAVGNKEADKTAAPSCRMSLREVSAQLQQTSDAVSTCCCAVGTSGGCRCSAAALFTCCLLAACLNTYTAAAWDCWGERFLQATATGECQASDTLCRVWCTERGSRQGRGLTVRAAPKAFTCVFMPHLRAIVPDSAAARLVAVCGDLATTLELTTGKQQQKARCKQR